MMNMKFVCVHLHFTHKRQKKTKTHIFKNEDAKTKRRRRRKFLENGVNLAVASSVYHTVRSLVLYMINNCDWDGSIVLSMVTFPIPNWPPRVC